MVSIRPKERQELEEELENIQYHIRLTKEHIDELNARFASYQPPPSIYMMVREL